LVSPEHRARLVICIVDSRRPRRDLGDHDGAARAEGDVICGESDEITIREGRDSRDGTDSPLPERVDCA